MLKRLLAGAKRLLVKELLRDARCRFAQAVWVTGISCISAPPVEFFIKEFLITEPLGFASFPGAHTHEQRSARCASMVLTVGGEDGEERMCAVMSHETRVPLGSYHDL